MNMSTSDIIYQQNANPKTQMGRIMFNIANTPICVYSTHCKKYISASRVELEKIMKYPIVIHKDHDSDYGVTVPDIPGCFSAGRTLNEAIDSANEAIECHLEGLLLDGEPVPVGNSIDKHQGNADYSGGVWVIVDIDLNKLSVKSKRVNITLPELLLNSVDHFADRHGESRSGLLARAVTEYMANHSTRGKFPN